MSLFDKLELLPSDPILSLSRQFAEDTHEKKANLGVGAYKDSEGRPVVLTAVRKAETMMLEKHLNKEYPPIQGHADFINESLKLIFGEKKIGNIFGAQTIGGTGALRIGGDFLSQHITKKIYFSEPTWPNHTSIFARAGMGIGWYPYYDATNKRLDFSGMCEAIQKMEPNSAIMFQGTCHNPTGFDPSFEQWKELSELVKKQHLIPFFDFAYQGFGDDLDEDAKPIRYFVAQGHEMLVAGSYSKNLGLYGERVGTLSVVTQNKNLKDKVGSNIKQIIRGTYSMPPLQGARIVATILQSEELRKEWVHELTSMRERIKVMRGALVSGLIDKGHEDKFSFMNQQRGMFSFSGLNQEQVRRLKKEYNIYMPKNGRVNIAGLNRNMDYVIKSIVSVIES